ncbi:MAG: hypothetical protein Q8869_00920, partial [Candidatus Phytoplasma australasiaticum]|nr:hypothetical protein [Candidatus Phytoplasma australasiaticum]
RLDRQEALCGTPARCFASAGHFTRPSRQTFLCLPCTRLLFAFDKKMLNFIILLLINNRKKLIFL